jgi:hypothetical protein
MPLSQRFKALPLASLTAAPSLPKVQRSAQPGDPALALLTDLHHSACVVASHRDGLDATVQLMVRAGVRMVFVSDVDGVLVGMVTAEHEHGLRYLLVTQTKQGVTTLRGLFSARRLEQALQTAIEPDLHSRSFAELGQALAH